MPHNEFVQKLVKIIGPVYEAVDDVDSKSSEDNHEIEGEKEETSYQNEITHIENDDNEDRDSALAKSEYSVSLIKTEAEHTQKLNGFNNCTKIMKPKLFVPYNNNNKDGTQSHSTSDIASGTFIIKNGSKSNRHSFKFLNFKISYLKLELFDYL
jgi:hypothetical protein